MSTTLIIGATSAMAEHAARSFAGEGHHLILAARSTDKLATLAEDLKVRGAASVQVLRSFDAANRDSVDAFAKEIDTIEGDLDYCLIAHGSLPDQDACEESVYTSLKELQINFISIVQLCTVLANRLEKQGSGTLAVISSVAGLRGRQSNYLYGSAKGGLNTFLSGLRNRLASKNARVLTILPGFVDTPMTADIEKGPLFVSAEKAGTLIHKAMMGKADVVYVPFFWRFILLIIRAIPEMIFKKLKL